MHCYIMRNTSIYPQFGISLFLPKFYIRSSSARITNIALRDVQLRERRLRCIPRCIPHDATRSMRYKRGLSDFRFTTIHSGMGPRRVCLASAWKQCLASICGMRVRTEMRERNGRAGELKTSSLACVFNRYQGRILYIYIIVACSRRDFSRTLVMAYTEWRNL